LPWLRTVLDPHLPPFFCSGLAIDVPGHGKVVVDIGYGGTFYAFLSAEQLGLDVCSSKTRDLVSAASAVTEAVKKQFKLHHPESEDLAFLYGTILTDGKDAFSEEPTTNICVFADEQVDRSPTGSGVTARIALQYHKGLIQLDQSRTFRSSTTGSLFTGKAVKASGLCWAFPCLKGCWKCAQWGSRKAFLFLGKGVGKEGGACRSCPPTNLALGGF
uniref:trans-L-3-hydroxyproline dehydratase n=1 Tax=Cyanistes caeruleus TaxID=156563 RepID=A0A8C0UWZ7_CYACU